MKKFQEIVEKIAPKLRAISQRLDGRYTAFDDDDLYQEALFYLWLKYQNGTMLDKTDSFILQGCYFFMKNYIRKNHKKLDRNSFSLYETKDDTENCWEQRLIACDKKTVIGFFQEHFLMDELSQVLDERQKIIVNWQIDGLSVREMGKRLGISHPMVVKIIKKIRERCKIFKE